MARYELATWRFRGTIPGVGLLLLAATSAPAQVNVGFHGGYAGSMTREGIAGFSETRLGKSQTMGATAAYRFGGGLLVGVRAENLRMPLAENGAKFGTLRMQPVLLTIGYQGMPKKGRGFTGHGQFGAGVAFTSFAKGPAITEIERLTRVTFETRTKTAPAGEVGGGLDYFVNRRLSLTTDFRLLLANVGTEFTAVGVRRVPVAGMEKFFASNAQALVGVRLWLK